MTQQQSTELLRSERPRATGVVAAVFAALLLVIAVLCFGLAYVAPGSTGLALAVVSAAIAALAFRVESAAKALLVPLRVLTIVAFGIGLIGAGFGLYLGFVQQTPVAIGASVGMFLASLVVALLGALVYGAADQRKIAQGA